MHVGYARPMQTGWSNKTLARSPQLAPCDDCQYRVSCASTGLVCRSFNSFVRGEPRKRWLEQPRFPSPKITEKARQLEEASELEAAAEETRRAKQRGAPAAPKRVPRHEPSAVIAAFRAVHKDHVRELRRTCYPLEKRDYMRAWRERNRDRIRARERERYERLKAAAPAKLARKRAYEREWTRAHPDATRLAKKTWRARNPDKVRAAKLRWYHAHREQSARANRAWRRAHVENAREQRTAGGRRTTETSASLPG
jgi:hypothetical protein